MRGCLDHHSVPTLQAEGRPQRRSLMMRALNQPVLHNKGHRPSASPQELDKSAGHGAWSQTYRGRISRSGPRNTHLLQASPVQTRIEIFSPWPPQSARFTTPSGPHHPTQDSLSSTSLLYPTGRPPRNGDNGGIVQITLFKHLCVLLGTKFYVHMEPTL